MSLVLNPDTLKQLCEIFDRLCTILGEKECSRDILAKRIIEEIASGASLRDLTGRMLQEAAVTYRLEHTERWEWKVLYRGTVVKSGAEETSVEARAAAVLCAGTFHMH